MILDYKSLKLKEIGICNVTKKADPKADCDNKPFYFSNYFGALIMNQILNRNFISIVKTCSVEKMNFFIITFNHSKKQTSDIHINHKFKKSPTVTQCNGISLLPH